MVGKEGSGWWEGRAGGTGERYKLIMDVIRFPHETPLFFPGSDR